MTTIDRQIKMKKFISFIFVIVACYYTTCFAEILKANDIKGIEETLASINQDTLVIFDVDDVLIMPKDQILQSHHRSYLHKLEKALAKQEKEVELFWGVILSQRQSILVDKRMPQILNELHSKGIKVLALTHAMTGKLGGIPSMKDWRYNELIHHGYDFEKSWQGVKENTFSGLEKSENRLSKDVSSPPMFFKGIIFTEIDKGEALAAFLSHYKLKFKKIIFIDDKKKNLAAVERIASKLNIAFVGIEYTAAAMPTEPLNQKRAQLQFKTLSKEKKWISDFEADALLANFSKVK